MAPLSLVPQSKLWDLNIAGSSIHTFSHYKGLAMKTVSDAISRLAFYHLLALQVNGKVIGGFLQ